MKIKDLIFYLKNNKAVFFISKNSSDEIKLLIQYLKEIYEKIGLKILVLPMLEYIDSVYIDSYYLNQFSLIILDCRIFYPPISDNQKSFYYSRIRELFIYLKYSESKRLLFISEKDENSVFKNMEETLNQFKLYYNLTIIK